MKKIAILTLVFNNYGTRLQSFALCNVLKKILKDKTEIEVINLECSWSNRNQSISAIAKRIMKGYGLKAIPHIIDTVSYIFQERYARVDNINGLKQKRLSQFAEFNKFIPYTETVYKYEDLRNGKLPYYDGIIVGSDQVWNGIKVGNQDIFMLDFYSNHKGFTYAASFGMTTVPYEMFPDYKRRINNFNNLLIREEEGIQICKQLGRDDAKLVLDPTLLLKEKDYSEIIDSDPIVDGDYILVYSLNYSLKIFDQAYAFAKRNHCKMIVLKRSFCPPRISKYKDAEELYAISPGSFLNLIKHARCVITNSYHALLFSIIFKVPFYVYLDNADEENSRILTITKMFNLGNRVYWEKGSLPKEINVVEYEVVYHILNQRRIESLAFLMESISSFL